MPRCCPPTRASAGRVAVTATLIALAVAPARAQVEDTAAVRVMVAPAFDGEWRFQIAAALAVRERLEMLAARPGSHLRVIAGDSVRSALERRRLRTDAPLPLPTALAVATGLSADQIVLGAVTSSGRGVRIEAAVTTAALPGATRHLPLVERATIAAAADSVAREVAWALSESRPVSQASPGTDPNLWLLMTEPAPVPRAQLIAESRRAIANEPTSSSPWLRLLSLYLDLNAPVLPFLYLADTLGAGSLTAAQAELLLGASHLIIGRSLTQDASKLRGCEMARRAHAELRAAGAALAGATVANPQLAEHLVRSQAQAVDDAARVQRESCGAAPD